MRNKQTITERKKKLKKKKKKGWAQDSIHGKLLLQTKHYTQKNIYQTCILSLEQNLNCLCTEEFD